MWSAIVPAFNESQSIIKVISNLNRCPIHQIILVANGCTDNTCQLAISTSAKRIVLLHFSTPVGIDIPRSIGAYFVKVFCPSINGLLFLDGDMGGQILSALYDLVQGIEDGLDMALTNCYPYIYSRSDLANAVLKERECLNRKLGLFNILGLASPSHGPHAVSRFFLDMVPIEALAVPPLSLVLAVKSKGLRVNVAAAIPHILLGSNSRSEKHASEIAETIIEDCQQALSYLNDQHMQNSIPKLHSATGYRSLRRFDLLKQFKIYVDNNYDDLLQLMQSNKQVIDIEF